MTARLVRYLARTAAHVVGGFAGGCAVAGLAAGLGVAADAKARREREQSTPRLAAIIARLVPADLNDVFPVDPS